MAHFKFLLDEGVKHLARHFPAKRVATLQSLGLPRDTRDDEIVEVASTRNYLLVSANREDFLRIVRAYVSRTTKKHEGCHRVPGLVLLVPNDEHTQERVLQGIESRLCFDEKKITFKDVHERDLLVQIEANGKLKVTRLPRCPHCFYEDTEL